MENIKERKVSINHIIVIIFYLFTYFILGSFIIIFVAGILCRSNPNVSYEQIVPLLSGTQEYEKAEESLKSVYLSINSLSNMLIYLFMLIVFLILMRKDLKEDFIKLQENQRNYAIIPLLGIGCFAVTLMIDMLVSSANLSSANQNLIVDMVQNGGGFQIFIMSVICAPIVEELFYRKAIFSILRKAPVWVSYIVSAFVFSIPHMLSTSASIQEWLIMLIPYLASGFLLSMAYHITGYNIYASWFAHFLNNLIAIMLILI